MKKQLAIAAGVFLTLGTAFSDPVRNEAPAASLAASVDFTPADASSRGTTQVVSTWKDQAKSGGPTRLARPL